ncbi:MAG: AAA family ATPase [Fusobacteriaceae bacterium]
MMKIQTLKLQNFKFFGKEEVLEFDGKNILIYGENGSGKSSIYWALYTLLQSSLKENKEIEKYFSLDGNESLVNRYQKQIESKIEIDLESKQIYINSSIEGDNRKILTNTNEGIDVKEIVMSSDFINYKLLLKFYDFKNSEDINLMKIFSEEIFQYIPSSLKYQEKQFSTYKDVFEFFRNPDKPNKSSKSYKDYISLMTAFNSDIKRFIEEINTKVNTYLNEFFDEKEIKINLKYIPFQSKKIKIKYETIIGEVHLQTFLFVLNEEETLFGKNYEIIKKPHTFFNEAKLTSIALAIRFSILENRLQTAPMKLLVLDDLLVSLDMSKRMQVMKIINEKFESYQKIILTHDRSFFEFTKFNLEKNYDNQWKYFEIYVNHFEPKPDIRVNLNFMEMANYYFNNHDYGSSANYLRKACEDMISKYINNRDLNAMIENMQKIFYYNKMKDVLEKSLIENDIKFNSKNIKIILENLKENDPRNFGESYGAISSYSSKILFLLDEKNKYQQLLCDIDSIRNSILNPASHSDVTIPIFREELREAIRKVKELKKILK